MRPTLGPKEKLSRRVGQNLFLKGERSLSQKHAMIRNPFPPGLHGKRRRKGASDFGQHLLEKQKIRYSYGISERQLRRYFNESSKALGNTAQTLFQKLETRLDNVVFKAGFVISRSIARHLVAHGHFLVNNRKVNLPSFKVSKGDIVSVRESSLIIPNFKDLKDKFKKYAPPSWISLDKEKLQAKIGELPKVEEAGEEFNLKAVVEFYSR